MDTLVCGLLGSKGNVWERKMLTDKKESLENKLLHNFGLEKNAPPLLL